MLYHINVKKQFPLNTSYNTGSIELKNPLRMSLIGNDNWEK